MVNARVVLLKDREGKDYICPQTVTSAIFDPTMRETLQQKLDKKCDKDFPIPRWEASITYKDLATVVYGNYHTFFMSKKDNNIGHEPTGAEDEWWTPVKGIDPTTPKIKTVIIPANTTGTYTVSHGLDSEDIVFSFRDMVTKKYLTVDTEYVDKNNVKLNFAKATLNDIRMFITASPQV